MDTLSTFLSETTMPVGKKIPFMDKHVLLMDFVKTLGLPTVFLGVVLFMLWESGTWAGNNVILPLFQKQVEFIDSATKMTAEINNTLVTQQNNYTKLHEAVLENRKIASDDVVKTLSVLKKIEDNISNKP